MVEIVTAVVSKAAAEAAKPPLAWVRRRCGYVISTDRYIGQLGKELEKLVDVRVEVQRSVNHADNNMWEIKREVNRWKNNAENVAKKARSVLDNDVRAKKTCFCGWLPNPKGRYCLGRDARKTAEAIRELIPQGKFERVYYESAPPGRVGDDGGDTIQERIARGQFENPPPGRVGDDGGGTIQELSARGQFEKVDFENPPPVLVGVASGVNSSASDAGDFITGSRASIFQDIMKALDDENLKVIGVYGPGGVGKTTLLKEVEKKLGEPGRPFRMIVKVRVSQTPDLNNIVDQIADAFGLEQKDKRSLQGKADVLSKRLKSNPDEKVLIIFDNLWVKLDLEAVGIPWGDVSSKCKLLLTSRFKDVLEKEMGADRTFLLQGLTDNEAFRLFENKVGDKLKDNEEFKSIADRVVKKLAGLPLLIISVASTLKSGDESAWRNALIEIDESNKQEKETIVRLSYEHLKSKDAKYLFLLCGLIGGTIPVERLFVLAMGLGLFERFNKTIQDSRDRLNNMLNELRSACLLLDGGDDKDKVTIHDLYSEVVVSTPFRDQNSLMMSSNYGSSSKEKLEKCWAICLDDVGRDRLAELMMCQFPSLKILMLSMPKVSERIEEHQHDMGDCSGLLNFTGMKELQVLYLCFMHITNLPLSIEILGNLRSLYICKCNVKDVAIIGKLKALQILSFAGSTISKLPKEIGDLTNLISLNLSKCDKLETIEPGVLKGLINLEELHLQGSFDQWMDNDEIPSESCNARLAELKSLKRMASLEISIDDPTILLEDDYQSFENLSRFWINIGNLYSREFKGLRTLNLNLEGCNSILSKEWVQKTLQKTQYLNLNGLKELKRNAHELCIQGFSQLKHLDIRNSPSIKYIANSSNDLILTAFTTLESLFLGNLINLEKICHGPTTLECFSKLKAVSVYDCNQLKYLWRLSEMQGLIQLEEIKVEYCDSMQAIVIDDARNDKVTTDGIVELPNIRHLIFKKLPNMTNFCSGAEITSKGALIQVGLPNLEKLELQGVGSPTLGNCSKLLNVFSSTVIGRLQNLKEVIIRDCDFLESFFDCGSLYANTEQTTVLLPKLESVMVGKARKLRCMVKSDSQMILAYPSLTFLSICKCPNFEAFIQGPISVKRQLGKTVEENDESPQTLFNEMVTFPNITILEIEGLRCKELWNNQIPIDSFWKLECLHLRDCDNLQRVAPSRMWKRLHRCLENLKVISCCSIEIIYEGDGMDIEGGELRLLVLRDLKNLRHIWQSNNLPNVPFPNLRDIETVRCPRLEMVFTTFTVKFLRQIKELMVESCEDMKQIAGHEKAEEATSTTITFFELTALRLLELPKFKSFLPERYSLKFPCPENCPSLRDLSIVSCGAEPDQALGDWERHQWDRQLYMWMTTSMVIHQWDLGKRLR